MEKSIPEKKLAELLKSNISDIALITNRSTGTIDNARVTIPYFVSLVIYSELFAVYSEPESSRDLAREAQA